MSKIGLYFRMFMSVMKGTCWFKLVNNKVRKMMNQYGSIVD